MHAGKVAELRWQSHNTNATHHHHLKIIEPELKLTESSASSQSHNIFTT